MIRQDQPACFDEHLLVRVSSREDGTMLDRTHGSFDDERQLPARREFCEASGVSYDGMVYARITYGEDRTYDDILEVDDSMTTRHIPGVEADALFTAVPGVGLFLPVADCVATVAYDPVQQHLALLHLGRHATLTECIAKTARLFESRGSNPADIVVWMSPSAQKESYVLKWFDDKGDTRWDGFVKRVEGGVYLDMQGYNRERWIDAGILPENIHISPVDTVTDPDYFSHSAGETSGRIAVLAMMK